MKVISPLLGFNNNVKHKGRVFHIQTEDSGVRHPHVITHLFADGGRILKTMKISYAEHVGEGNMQETVRQLMKEQHKAMFIALRDGQFDHIFENEGGAPAAAPAPAATPTPQPAPAPPPPPPPPPPAATAKAPATTPEPPSSVPVPPVPPSVPKLNLPRGPIPSVTMPKVDPAAAPMVRPGAPDPQIRAKGEGVELDMAMLDRAASVAESPFVQQTQDLPPPPATLKKPGTLFTAGVYRALGTGEPAASAPPSAGRYAPSRPPAIFASNKPTQGGSIFGEDLISEKSLDEVILSYLAEDLEGSDGI